MILLFLAVLLLHKVSSDVICPLGYTDGGNDVCYKVYSTTVTRPSAAKQCRNDGGSLASIPNLFINSLIQSQGFQQNLQTVWFGLTCETNQVTSCIYDDSTSFLTDKSVTNFYPGNPNQNAGSCIYMSIKGGSSGTWFSADCDNTVSAFACETNVGGAVGGCTAGYTENAGMCYKAIPAADEASAESSCVAECGHLTSILSADENKFVRDLAGAFSTTDLYVRIGLKMISTNKYAWVDGTAWDPSQYTNFGMINSNLGNCVGMALKDDAVPQGEWINNKCNGPFISVCKKAKGSQCAATTASPTLSPVKCTTTTFLNNNGTIYSPGYPNAYVSNKCEYILTVDPAFAVSIDFSILNLDGQSRIELYYDIGDTTPFKTLYGSQGANTWYNSNRNELKMIFYSPNGGTGNQLWRADFKPIANYVQTTKGPYVSSGCNQGLIYAPGVITSPNYPNNYPDNADCSYQLAAGANQRIQLVFNEVMTEQGLDIITVYDGPVKDNTRILARISGFNPRTVPYISTSNRMFVTFTSDSMDNYKGFSATFTAI